MNSQNHVGVIGPGRIGQALGRLLAQADVPIEWVAARRLDAARKAARFIGAGRPVTFASPEMASANVLLLTTSDSALPEVAQNLAARRTDWKGAVVLHTSGAWPAGGSHSVLQPLRRRGAFAASMHPLQTVPSREAGAHNLIKCWWAVEGDRPALQIARRWIRALDGHAFTIPPNRKGAYHAAAVLACAGVVTLMESSCQLLEQCGVDPPQARNMLKDFVSETAKSFAALGAQGALTGPAVRGDWTTVQKHAAVLKREAPHLVPLYRELLHVMLRLTGERLPAETL